MDTGRQETVRKALLRFPWDGYRLHCVGRSLYDGEDDWSNDLAGAIIDALDGTSWTCPDCGMTSHSPQDIRLEYCGNCHTFPETRA